MDKNVNDKMVFDLNLAGFNFSAGVVALAAIRSGLKAAIELEELPSSEFWPELSHFHPSTVAQTRKAYANFQFLLKCSSLFPHLYFPKRTLFFQSAGKLNSGLNTSFDQLLGRDRESSWLPVKTEQYQDYQNLSRTFERGALVYEYQLDRNRATFELLKMCLNEGAVLVTHNQAVKSKINLKCKPFEFEKFSIKLENNYHYPNPLRIKTRHFEFILNSIHSGTFLQVHFTKPTQDEVTFLEQVKELFVQLKLEFSERIISGLKQIFSFQTIKIDSFEQEIPDGSLHNLRQEIIKIQQILESHLKVKIGLKKLFNHFPSNAMTGETFRSIQNECDEKFDLAKQTGIIYSAFAQLFYRYRFQIDSMIDSAYELMNQDRNPITIWQKVESDFQQSEWKTLSQFTK